MVKIMIMILETVIIRIMRMKNVKWQVNDSGNDDDNKKEMVNGMIMVMAMVMVKVNGKW